MVYVLNRDGKANPLSGGRRKNNQSPYLVKGFRLFDKVGYNGQECFIFGRRATGSFDVRLIDGTKVNAGVSYKKLQFLEPAKRYFCSIRKEGNGTIPPPPEVGGFLVQLS